MLAFVVVAIRFDMTCEQAEVDHGARGVKYEIEYLRADRDVRHAGCRKAGPKQRALRLGRDSRCHTPAGLW